MLKIQYTIPESEYYDEGINEFITYPQKVLDMNLEHSLVSISRWEAKHHKSFLSSKDVSEEEMADYICCMDMNDQLTLSDVKRLPFKIIKQIQDYIQDPMTATTFSDNKQKTSREIITSEIIYYDMVAAQIPFECEHWHINRLLTLIRICSIKNGPPKKMSKSEVMARNRALNAQRKAKYHTKG